MAGMPGAGKTAISLELGRALGWPVVDKDTLKSPLLTGGIREELAGPASYALLLEVAEDLLVRQRLSVILDSPGRFPSVIERARDLAEQVGGRLKIIRCVAARELRRRRLDERVARASQWTADTGLSDEEERRMFEHLPPDALVLDTSRPFDSCVEEALAYVKR